MLVEVSGMNLVEYNQMFHGFVEIESNIYCVEWVMKCEIVEWIDLMRIVWW